MIEQLEARVIVIVFDKFVTVILSEKDTIKAKSYGFRNADNRTTTHDYSIQFNSIQFFIRTIHFTAKLKRIT